ncbi:unnamed protein product, partial [Polarella glacialis]
MGCSGSAVAQASRGKAEVPSKSSSSSSVGGKDRAAKLRDIRHRCRDLQAAGRLDEASHVLGGALQVSETVLGVEHPDTVDLVFDLAQLLRVMGQLQE